MLVSLSARSLPSSTTTPSSPLPAANESVAVVTLENKTETSKANQSSVNKEIAVLTHKLMSSGFRYKQKLLVKDLLQYIRLKEKVHCLLNGYLCDDRLHQTIDDDSEFSGRVPSDKIDNDDDNLETPPPGPVVVVVSTPSNRHSVPNHDSKDESKDKPCLTGNVGGSNCANVHNNKEGLSEDHNDKFHSPG